MGPRRVIESWILEELLTVRKKKKNNAFQRPIWGLNVQTTDEKLSDRWVNDTRIRYIIHLLINIYFIDTEILKENEWKFEGGGGSNSN